MPRSPLVTRAVRELAKYFQAVTDAAFIDQSYNLIPSGKERAALATGGAETRIETNREIYNRAIDYTEGTLVADHIANLINGSVNFALFWNEVSNGWSSTVYNEEFKFLRIDPDFKIQPTPRPSPTMKVIDTGDLSSEPSVDNPNLYAILVNNPYMGPMTKDTGAVEIFMNGIPTLEFSKCVPYINLEIVSLRKVAGTTAPSLTLQGYLNPSKLGSADEAILKGSETKVRSEVVELGNGIRSGIELFTTPQTLANLGDTGPEFVPVVDRFRPFASLGNLSLSTKLQGGALSFTTGKLEITIHDRSRLREAAAFVRPDLYGTTFLDITYGWSHPDGGIFSSNSYGKFLDALKTTTRYRISNSSYSFEEGGSIKVTLSIQSVGTIDLLYLGPRQTSPHYITMQQIIRKLNERLAELRFRGTSPSMAEYDIIDTFKDPASALRAASDSDALKKLRDIISKSGDQVIASELAKLVGNATGNNAEVGGEIDKVQKELVKPYTDMVDNLPSIASDEFAADFLGQGRFEKMNSQKVILESIDAKTNTSTTESTEVVKGNDVYTPAAVRTDFVTYGSVFMEMIAKPVALSKQYDEIQVIFYPFNKYAGAVHDLPISSFPIERARLNAVIAEAAKSSPELSARAIIGLLYNDFLHFTPSRAYLMSGFYKAKEDDKTDMEAVPLKDSYKIKTGTGKSLNAHANLQLTFEQRLKDAGVPEGTFRMPVIEVAVEASPLLKPDGSPITDDRGNSKTIIKVHVYDSSMDPHSTLTDIIKASKDNELGAINLPVAQYQSAMQSSRGSAVIDSEMKNKYKIIETLAAGLKTGLLEPIDITGNGDGSLAGILEGTVALRIKGGYDEVKKMVTAGMPTIIYGSSATAMTNANLTTGGSAGLANVQLQRAFASPGETATENIDSGVPMQVLPAQLSIGTIGCPLFSPMQRFFVDFGTGTSIDHVYFVTSVDSNIGKDGYKTDVKMSFGEGFATYRSLNQQLATMAANWKSATAQVGEQAKDETVASTSEIIVFASDLKRSSNELERLINEATGFVARATVAQQIKIEEALKVQIAKIEDAKAAVVKRAEQKIEALIPRETIAKAKEIQLEAERYSLAVQAAATEAQKIAAYIAMLQNVNALAASLPAEIVVELFKKSAEREAEEARKAKEAAAKKPAPPKKKEGTPSSGSSSSK